MGLSASQARLLTITSRKSDCEFQSMNLSHQKLSIARDLENISNEYQNSLGQTKLIYDYYGTGTSTDRLNYAMLMTPSTLNNFLPVTITNSKGGIVLDKEFAEAAAAADIPPEGFGTLPSSDVRDKFLEALKNNNKIGPSTYNKAISVPYNQNAGFGSSGLEFQITKEITLDSIYADILAKGDEMKAYQPADNIQLSGKYYGDECDDDIKNDTDHIDGEHEASTYLQIITWTKSEDGSIGSNFPDGNENRTEDNYKNLTNYYDRMTLASLLNFGNNTTQYYSGCAGISSENSPVTGVGLIQNSFVEEGGFISWLHDEFTKIFGDNATIQTALNYASQALANLITGNGVQVYDINGTQYTPGQIAKATGVKGDLFKNGKYNELYDYSTDLDVFSSYSSSKDKNGIKNNGGTSNALDKVGTRYSFANDVEDVRFKELTEKENHIGFLFTAANQGRNGRDRNNESTVIINMNNMAKSYLTYFAQFMTGGLANLNNSRYQVKIGDVGGSCFVDDIFSCTYTDTVKLDDTYKDVVFYDTLFNQICLSGWSRNDEVSKPDYLQEMIQNGSMFITTISDDDYYYQRNYATYTYVKEISDDEAIAKAEAKYNTVKERLSAKEQTIDLKMKNLDTEITSLTTEYDTVKNLLTKNIEKTFKRYSA